MKLSEMAFAKKTYGPDPVHIVKKEEPPGSKNLKITIRELLSYYHLSQRKSGRAEPLTYLINKGYEFYHRGYDVNRIRIVNEEKRKELRDLGLSDEKVQLVERSNRWVVGRGDLDTIVRGTLWKNRLNL